MAILQSKFDEVGISYEIVEPKPGRGNIVARVPGDGSSGKGALLLTAHLDTVYAPKKTGQRKAGSTTLLGLRLTRRMDACTIAEP